MSGGAPLENAPVGGGTERETPAASAGGSLTEQPSRPRLSPLGWAWLVALLGWTTIVSFYALGGGSDFDPPDAWVAQTAREMQESGSWYGYIVPHFSGEVRLQKSPGPYWLVCLTAWLRGTPVDVVSARMHSAASAVVLVAVVFWLTWRIAGERAAIFAGFALASSALLLYWSHRAASDLGVTTCITLSLACLWAGSELEPPGWRRIALWLLGYFAAGLGMLYKMPMPLPCIGIPALVYVLIFRRWGLFASLWHVPGLALFLLPWLPWVLAVIQAEPTALDKWWVEFVDRYTGEMPPALDSTEREGDWTKYLFYLGVAAVFAIPYTLSIPGAITRACRTQPGVHDRGRWFLLIWLVSLLVFFTLGSVRETRYFLPGLPPLFALLGIELAAFFDPQRRPRPALERGGLILIGVAAPAGAVAGGWYLKRLSDRMAEYGVYGWEELGPAYCVAAAIFVVGIIAATLLYVRRREHASFAALVAMMWAAWMWIWPVLMPAASSDEAIRDFADQLRRIPIEHRARLRQIAHQDSRVIWHSDVRYPRVLDQLDLLERQGGERSREKELRLVAEEMLRKLESDELWLFVAHPLDYGLFQARVPVEMALEGRRMPRTYLWVVGRIGRPDHRYLVFGNRPPPWPEPELHPQILQAIERRRAKEAQQAGLAPGEAVPGSRPGGAPATLPASSRPASGPSDAGE